MQKPKPTTSSHANPDDTPRSPRKPRQNYRQLNDMRAPNRSPEEIAVDHAQHQHHSKLCQEEKEQIIPYKAQTDSPV